MLRLTHAAACLWLLAMIATPAGATPRPLAPPVTFTPFAYDPTFRRAWVPDHDGVWRLTVPSSGTPTWQWVHAPNPPSTLTNHTLTVREQLGTPVHAAPNGAVYVLTPPSGCPGCLDGWQWTPFEIIGAPVAAGPVIYDDLRDRLLMVSPLGQVSAMDFGPYGYTTGEWSTLAVTATLPVAQNDAAIVMDWERDQLVLAGGQSPLCPYGRVSSTDVWVMSLAGPGPYHWTALPDVPYGGSESDLVVDTANDRVLWVGGHSVYDCDGSYSETWSAAVYALPLTPVGSWASVGTVTWGADVEPEASAFDPGRGVLTFGGHLTNNGTQVDAPIRSVLLALPNGVLSFAEVVAGAPPGRDGSQTGFDVANRVLLLQGGHAPTSDYGDYQTFGDGNVWDAGSVHWSDGGYGPQVADGATVAIGGLEFLVFGGYYDSPYPVDPLQYTFEVRKISVDQNLWETLSVQPGPSPRYGAAAAWDAAGQRMLMYGGLDPNGLCTDLWALDLQNLQWGEAHPTGFTPAPGDPVAAAWDPATARLYLATRTLSGQVVVWYANSGLTQCTQLATTGLGPTYTHSMDIDPATHSLIVLDDHVGVWRLPLDGPAHWQQVDGSTRSIGWNGYGHLFVDGDRALAVYANPAQIFEVSLNAVTATPTPTSAPIALSLRVVGPHPARAPRVSFTLPHAAPARFELFDIAGRRVWSRDVAGAGPHELSVGEGALAAGVYQARLSHSGAQRTMRLVVLP